MVAMKFPEKKTSTISIEIKWTLNIEDGTIKKNGQGNEKKI